jgi:hypothetical protein
VATQGYQGYWNNLGKSAIVHTLSSANKKGEAKVITADTNPKDIIDMAAFVAALWLGKNRGYTGGEISESVALGGLSKVKEKTVIVVIAIQGTGKNYGYKYFTFEVAYTENSDFTSVLVAERY